MTPLGMLAEHLAEATLVLTVALAATALLRRQSAALKHAILATSLLAIPLIPATALVSPAWEIPGLAAWWAEGSDGRSTLRWAQEPAAPVPAAAQTSATAGSRGAASWATLGTALTGVWFAGVAIGLLHLLVGIRRLSRQTRATVPVTAPGWTTAAVEIVRRLGITSRVELRHSDNPTLLVTWGLWRPRVIVPHDAADWPAGRIRSVLAHELAHVRRGDWAIQMAAESVRILYWFHPLAWLACRRLRDESEHACDDTVIANGVVPHEYATHLYEVAQTFAVHPRRWVPAAAIARPSTLEKRIAAVLTADSGLRRTRRWAPAAAVVMMGSIAVVSAGFEPALGEVEGPVLSAVEGPALNEVEGPASSAAERQQAGETLVFGRIVDESGGVLPGVQVHLRRSTEAEGRRTMSDRNGYYEFADVPAGDAVVTMSLPGFRTGSAAVAVPPFGTVEFSTTLGIGALEETITVTGRRGAAPPPSRPRQSAVNPPPSPPLQRRTSPPPAAVPDGPVRMGGQIKAPNKIVDVRPIYPPAAQANGLDGVVILEATINAVGSTQDIKVLRALEPDLNDAAIDAVKGWKFTPTLLNGAAVPVIMTVTVHFALQ